MIKEVKYIGLTATPTDYQSDDGELAIAANIVPEDGALRPILPPGHKFTLNQGETVLWIHNMTAHTHYIIMLTTTNEGVTSQSLQWICEQEGDWTRHDIAGSAITGTPTINSLGNTLVVNDDNGVQYFLWSTEGSAHYEALGQKPPMLDITFGLHSDFAVWPETPNEGKNPGDFKGTEINVGRINDSGYFPKLGTESGDGGAAWVYPQPLMAVHSGSDPLDERIRDFANEYATFSVEGMNSTTQDSDDDMLTIKNRLSQGVFATLNKFVNEKGVGKNKFVLPFFVRYAYRMYDDSYIMHSYPVLMIPNSRGPVFCLDGRSGMMLADYNGDTIGFKMRGRVYGFLSDLVYSIPTVPANLNKWKDLIMSVDIAVSAPIYTYDQAGYVWGWTNMDGEGAWEEYFSCSKITKLAGKDDYSNFSPYWGPTNGINMFLDVFSDLEQRTRQENYGQYYNRYNNDYTTPNYIATIPQHNIADINNKITGTGNFYVIKQFTLEEITQVNDHGIDLEQGLLGGLLGRKTMNDDYHSHDTIKASIMHGFNGRMNYAGIERTPHNPLSPAVTFPQVGPLNSGGSWEVAIQITNESQTLTLKSDDALSTMQFPRWVFYPDANAKFAFIKNGTSTYKIKLKPHELLNGSYWLCDDWIKAGLQLPGTVSFPTVSSGAFVEQNKVYTSNVNNPFVFEPTNINTVGTGKILGICPAVRPLADDQFGKAPLYVFASDGLWAMDTTNTGTYASVWPLPRDVLSKDGNANYNHQSITQLDDTVLFATDRGIMQISGGNTQCISEAINSEHPFDIDSLPGNLLSMLDDEGYDTDALQLLPFSQFLAGCRMIYDYVHQRIIVYNSTCNYAYVYSIKSNSWGMMITSIDYSINSYPDALAVTDDNTLVNLSVHDDVGSVKGLVITRPLKLDYPNDLKTVDTIIQRGMFDFNNATRSLKPIRTILYASRDLYNWHLVYSSDNHYLRGFRGTPYKFFRVALITDLKSDESIYGCTVQYTPRMLNQPR